MPLKVYATGWAGHSAQRIVSVTEEEALALLQEIDGLLVFPWEDPAQLSADRDNILDETFRMPWLGIEPSEEVADDSANG